MFLRRSLALLAGAYKLLVYDFFFFMSGYIWGLAPPPHTKELATLLLLPAFAHQKSGQMKLADSVPPTRYTKSPPLRTRNNFLSHKQARVVAVSTNGTLRLISPH